MKLWRIFDKMELGPWDLDIKEVRQERNKYLGGNLKKVLNRPFIGTYLFPVELYIGLGLLGTLVLSILAKFFPVIIPNLKQSSYYYTASSINAQFVLRYNCF